MGRAVARGQPNTGAEESVVASRVPPDRGGVTPTGDFVGTGK